MENNDITTKQFKNTMTVYIVISYRLNYTYVLTVQYLPIDKKN